MGGNANRLNRPSKYRHTYMPRPTLMGPRLHSKAKGRRIYDSRISLTASKALLCEDTKVNAFSFQFITTEYQLRLKHIQYRKPLCFGDLYSVQRALSVFGYLVANTDKTPNQQIAKLESVSIWKIRETLRTAAEPRGDVCVIATS